MPAQRDWVVVDGNEAAASVAYRLSEVIAIYPITPASPMGELSDEWSTRRRMNVWGGVPQVTEMQSEGGAAGAIHGALQAGALATTFTASQGLLLMIPNLYKIAGELTPFCLHVAARSVATHALSIFGDHSDVMACRQTGMALLASSSVQEAHDLACVAHAATLRSRVPFLHFFDGFRTSHELSKVQLLSDDDLRAMVSAEAVAAHRARALSPDHPVVRGTAQNPDAFFQAREASNPFYVECPRVVEGELARFAERTGRRYGLFDYFGHPQAERVIVMMGSGAQAAQEAVEWLSQRGEKVGLVGVRLYRPFSLTHFAAVLPKSVRRLAVLDRTKEPGAVGEPLYQDVVSAVHEGRRAHAQLRVVEEIVGGRYGLSSKEFTPAMVRAVLDNLGRAAPQNHFTVGINDDVTHTSLEYDRAFEVESNDVVRALFFGLGSDGTVGANKSSIKIIGEETDHHVQGYFVYDSKKAGAVTVSHLRFGPRPLRSTYLIKQAGFVACHQFHLLDSMDVVGHAEPGGVLLLNAPHAPGQVWDALSREVQAQILEKHLRVFVIDASRIAEQAGLGRRINTVMQICFFALSNVLPREAALAKLKASIEKTYAKKGHAVVEQNLAAVARTLENLHAVPLPTAVTTTRARPARVPADAPDFVQRVTASLMAGLGDLLPVSAFPVDGTWPVGTSRYEKRNIARDIPVWDAALCIQCNKCALVCPHAAIRAKVYEPACLQGAPITFKSVDWRGKDWAGSKYTLQVAPEDCTGCTLCYEVCPAKDKSNPRHRALEMAEQAPLRDAERANFDFFLKLPEAERARVKLDVKSTQLFEPLFEFSGACAGCGETPYIKLLTQLFGDRALIANATGCSSIFGGNLPTTPYSKNADGRGPAWANSLFEDNAEFGFGLRLGVDAQREQARALVRELAGELGDELAAALLDAPQGDETELRAQRERVALLRQRLAGSASPRAKTLVALADYLVRKSVWLVGGDGWAYDIGYGGLDHVLGQERKVNVLVLDTEVYSNTGGQASKATPLAAAAKFAFGGKSTAKKDLGMEAMSYGHVYVARVAFGAKDNQTLQAFLEADAYPGPSLIIAYSPCIAHGYDLVHGLHQQDLAVRSGAWPLYRFDPRRVAEGKPPLHLDSAAPKVPLSEYMRGEARFRMVEGTDPQRFRELTKAAQLEATQRFALYQQLAGVTLPSGAAGPGNGGAP